MPTARTPEELKNGNNDTQQGTDSRPPFESRRFGYSVARSFGFPTLPSFLSGWLPVRQVLVRSTVVQDLVGSSAGRCGRGTRNAVQAIAFSACDQPGGGHDEIEGSMLAGWVGCRFGWSLACGLPIDRPFLVSSVLPRLFSPRTGPLQREGNTQGKTQN